MKSSANSATRTSEASQQRRRGLRRGSLAVVLVAGLVTLGAGLWQPAAFWPAWLLAVLFVLGLGLGSLAIALLHRLTGGRWGFVTLRELIAAAGTVPFMTLLLLPLLVGADSLYPWLTHSSGSETHSAQRLNAHQQAYYGAGAWAGRGVLYGVIWTALVLLAVWAYRGLCRTEQSERWHVRLRISAIGLILWWMTVTFAAVDWIMSLEPAWTSTIYGAIVAMGFVLAGWTAVILLRRLLGAELAEDAARDLGNLVLAFLLVWVYFAFSQFLIIWSGDLPHESVWYMRRTTGIWGLFGTLLLVFHFVVPFAVLLSRDLKQNLRSLSWLCGGILLMRIVDLTWTILPALGSAPDTAALVARVVLVPATVLAVGGVWLLSFLTLWSWLPAVPATVLQPSAPTANSPATQESHA